MFRYDHSFKSSQIISAVITLCARKVKDYRHRGRILEWNRAVSGKAIMKVVADEYRSATSQPADEVIVRICCGLSGADAREAMRSWIVRCNKCIFGYDAGRKIDSNLSIFSYFKISII